MEEAALASDVTAEHVTRRFHGGSLEVGDYDRRVWCTADIRAALYQRTQHVAVHVGTLPRQ